LVIRLKNFAVVRGSGKALLASIIAFRFAGDLDGAIEIFKREKQEDESE
jgi:hypothetical protein